MRPTADQVFATRFTPPGYGCGSPLLIRAEAMRSWPAPNSHVRPPAWTESSARVRGARPPSTAAMMAGQASRVDVNRPITLLDGINRSRYSIAPSTRISDRSPGLRAYRPISAVRQSRWLVSGRLSLFVDTSFALRGAPCGDDPRPWAAHREYHHEKHALRGMAQDPNSWLDARMRGVGHQQPQRIAGGLRGFTKRDSMLPEVLLGLQRIPVVAEHRRTVASELFAGAYSSAESAMTVVAIPSP